MYSIIDVIAENRSEAKFEKNAEHDCHDYTMLSLIGGVLIDLIIGFLGLIIKAFDNPTESWADYQALG